jgi:WD40 repeat protein
MGRPPDRVFAVEGRPTAGASEVVGDSLAASFPDGTLRVYGPGGDLRRAWKAGEKGFVALSFSRDGRRLVGGGGDGRVVVADSATGRAIGSFAALGKRIDALAVSREGSVVATSAGSEAAAFRVEGGARLFTLGSTFAEVSDLAVSPTGDRVAVAFTDVDVRLVDAATGRVAAMISDLEMAAFSLAFSADGRFLAFGCADGRVSIRDAASGARVRADVRHTEPVGAVGFTPDGAWLASVGLSMNPATREASVRMTSVSAVAGTTESLGVLPYVLLGFSADGTARVFSPGPEGLRVWNVAPPRSPA